jgi:hypothetical protein
VASIDYKETALWQRAKALLVETFRLTRGWPEDGKDLSDDLRACVRQIVKSVPGAFKRNGISGNVHVQMLGGLIAELEALCEAAEALRFVEPEQLQPLLQLSLPMQTELRDLAKASRERTRELISKRTQLLGGGLNEEDDDV